MLQLGNVKLTYESISCFSFDLFGLSKSRFHSDVTGVPVAIDVLVAFKNMVDDFAALSDCLL